MLLALLAALQSSPPPLVRTNIGPPPIVQTVREAPPPVITPTAPRNQDWRYKNWAVHDYRAFTIASTENQSGSAFGMICIDQCYWFVNFTLDCDKGHKYPAMINSPEGAKSVELECVHVKDLRLLSFDVDDVSLSIMATGGEIGIAVPKAGGAFTVSRFSLDGGADAIAKGMTISVENGKKTQKGLKDYEL